MSNDKSRDAMGGAAIPQSNNSAEMVKTSSPFDFILWIIALALFGGALIVCGVIVSELRFKRKKAVQRAPTPLE